MDLQQLLMNTASLGKIALFNCIIRPFSFLQWHYESFTTFCDTQCAL